MAKPSSSTKYKIFAMIIVIFLLAAGFGFASKEPPLSEMAFQSTQSPNWALVLVNENNPLPEHFSVKTKELPSQLAGSSGQAIDERAYDALCAMLEDASKKGLDLKVCSSYREISYQQNLFQKKVEEYQNSGLTKEDAFEKAKTIVALPGASEHNLGLAVDICAESYQVLDEGYASTEEAKWLKKNAAKYGFILRYPKEKEHITGIVFEPWHYRYVGKSHAERIMKSGLVLEEYLDRYDQ